MFTNNIDNAYIETVFLCHLHAIGHMSGDNTRTGFRSQLCMRCSVLIRDILRKILGIVDFSNIMIQSTDARSGNICTNGLCRSLGQALHYQTMMKRARSRNLQFAQQRMIHICPFQPGNRGGYVEEPLQSGHHSTNEGSQHKVHSHRYPQLSSKC